MKRIITLVCAIMMTLCISAHAQKTVVAYFSATGTTEAAAQKLAKEKNAELYKIEPKTAYTDEDLDWHNQQSRSSVEMKDKSARPELKEQKSLSQYEIIYIGYPIWWGVAPRIINTFIEQAQIDGKKVIPFATSGSSTVEKSVTELEASYPKIKWQKGLLLNKK